MHILTVYIRIFTIFLFYFNRIWPEEKQVQIHCLRIYILTTSNAEPRKCSENRDFIPGLKFKTSYHFDDNL